MKTTVRALSALTGALLIACLALSMQPAPTAAQSATATPAPRPTPSPTPTRLSAIIEVDALAEGASISPRMFGSNLPAWLGRQVFENPIFRTRVAASGLRLLRIPGGSWGDSYGWLSCELGQDVPGAFPCRFPWAARPTDFLNFFRAMDGKVEPMYIVNVNYTAQEAAALVAFFNSPLTDTTRIGTDIRGTDWYTAGRWAQLRATGGNPEPLGIKLWEIGNEVYGGKPTVKGCPSNGWEETWTCNGEEYIKGNAEHDGFIKMRQAMKAVDSTILVGAVGVEGMAGKGWGYNVLTHGGQAIDYYVVHAYPQYFDYRNPQREIADLLVQPQRLWAKIKSQVDYGYAEYAGGRDIPLVLNEFNIVPQWGIAQDYRNYMNKQVNALFIADSLGQMIAHGYAMAAQWAVMNGISPELAGREVNEFGLMFAYERDPKMTRQPTYYVFPIWARFGDRMLLVRSSADAERALSVYAGRTSEGEISILIINKDPRPADVQITLTGVRQITAGRADTLTAESADSFTALFNGVADPKDDLSNAPPQPVNGSQNNRLRYTASPHSITLLRLDAR